MGKLYTFGDSFTYGFNFLPDDARRVSSIWPTKLSRLLGRELVDLSIPGGSNWRIARLIASIDFDDDDLIVIGFSTHTRFEFGVSLDHADVPPSKNKFGVDMVGDVVEIDGNLKVRKFFSELDKRSDDIDVKLFSAMAFSEFFNEEWFSRMQGVCFNSIQHNLRNNKWLAFNAWCLPFQANDFWLKSAGIKNYVLGVDGIMDSAIKKTSPDSMGIYWTPEQHNLVADIVLKEYGKIYG